MNVDNNNYIISFTNDFSDDLFQFEMESKGYLYNTKLLLKNGRSFNIVFYDTTRFKQDVDEVLENGLACFYEENLVIVEKLTKEILLEAIEYIWNKKLYLKMVPLNEEE